MGFLKPGAWCSGTMSWTRYGETSGSINFSVDLRDPDRGVAHLWFSHEGVERRQIVQMAAVPCRYGGRRYYFLCPKTGQLCAVLCCVHGYFASRQYHRLAYSSQSEDYWDRLLRARNKVQARLDGEDGRPRPKGRNRERLFARWQALEEGLDRRLVMFVDRYRAKYGADLDL